MFQHSVISEKVDLCQCSFFSPKVSWEQGERWVLMWASEEESHSASVYWLDYFAVGSAAIEVLQFTDLRPVHVAMQGNEMRELAAATNPLIPPQIRLANHKETHATSRSRSACRRCSGLCRARCRDLKESSQTVEPDVWWRVTELCHSWIKTGFSLWSLNSTRVSR